MSDPFDQGGLIEIVAAARERESSTQGKQFQRSSEEALSKLKTLLTDRLLTLCIRTSEAVTLRHRER